MRTENVDRLESFLQEQFPATRGNLELRALLQTIRRDLLRGGPFIPILFRQQPEGEKPTEATNSSLKAETEQGGRKASRCRCNFGV